MRPLVAAVVVSSFIASFALTASASECVPTPMLLPGLSGPPDWVGTAGGTDWRPELNDPRWASAELRRFGSFTDPDGIGTAEQARYRVLFAGNALYVNLQLLVDPTTGSTETGDTAYFAFDEGNLGTRAWAVAIRPDRTSVAHTAADAPAATVPQETPPERLPYTMATAASLFDWFENTAGTTADWDGAHIHAGSIPPWISDVATWRQAYAGTWAITFKVDLASLGFPATPPATASALRMFFGARVTHVPAGTSPGVVDFRSSPLVGAGGVVGTVSGTLDTVTNIPRDKSTWLEFSPPGYGTCTPGASIDSSKIGRLDGANLSSSIEACSNVAGCSTSPTCYTTPGCVACCPAAGHPNTFEVRVQNVGTPSTHSIRAKFRIAEWGSTIANWQFAPWRVIPISNTNPTGMDTVFTDPTLSSTHWSWSLTPPVATIDFTCGTGPNSYCPELTNADGYKHQCMLVELANGPGGTQAFSRVAAYRNMNFVGLSESVVPATISIKGLQQAIGEAGDRDVYLYVETRNMPPAGEKPLWLRHSAMAAARAYAMQPPVIAPEPEPQPEPEPEPNPNPKAGQPGVPAQPPGAKPAGAKPVAAKPDPKKADPKAPGAKGGRAVRPEPNRLASSQPKSVLDVPVLSAEQALTSVWPTLRVFPYFDTGKTTVIAGTTYKKLEPMVPFGFYLDHEGPFYGFKHALEGLDGLVVTELAPGYFKIRVPSEGAVRLQTRISAEEKPPSACPPKALCDSCYPPKSGRCHCRFAGERTDGTSSLLGALVLALVASLRRRRRPD